MRSKRDEAAKLFARGVTRAETARRLGISRSTAGEWYRLWRATGGVARSRPGPRPRLGPEPIARLSAAFLRPPREAGFSLERWSLAAIARWIEAQAGIAYHPRHVGRVLARAGFVVPPAGPCARDAMLRVEVSDPDGGEVAILVRGFESEPRARGGVVGRGEPRGRPRSTSS